MKFFVSVFLHVLCSFSLIKTVHSLECYVISDAAYEASFRECQNSIRGKISKEDSKDEVMSKVFGCIRNGVRQESAICDPEDKECGTATFELKDETQLMFKGCGNSGGGDCNLMKSSLGLEDFVKTVHCDFCSSNNCNNQKPKTVPRSLSAVSAPPTAAVFITVLIIHILL